MATDERSLRISDEHEGNAVHVSNNGITAIQAELLSCLAGRVRVRRDRSDRPSVEDFVLKYGWWYRPTELPARIGYGESGWSFENASRLAIKDRGLVYCEGFVLAEHPAPLLQAWVTDGDGQVIDNTGDTIGLVYLGVPFKTGYVLDAFRKNRAFESVINDWRNFWPLCHELGDRPEKWLELRGEGEQRVRPEISTRALTKPQIKHESTR